MAAYASGNDLLVMYDQELVSQLCSKNGVQVQLADIPTNPVILAQLNRATAEINQACTLGNRYFVQDLQGLAASTDDSIRWSIAGLCCAIAMGLLVEGKATTPKEVEALASGFARAQQIMEMLRQGQLVFPLVPQQTAGVQITRLALGQGGPFSVPNLTCIAQRYFGNLAIQSPGCCNGGRNGFYG